MSAKKTSRCWPGYEPVPGKKPASQGSCRPKSESKSTAAEKTFKDKRKKQLDEWQKDNPGAKRQAAQHLTGPSGESSAKKRAPAKKTSAKKKTVGFKRDTRKPSGRKSD